MLAGRAGEIVSRRETPSQCGRVGSRLALRDVKWPLCPQILINSYLNATVVYLGLIRIHIYYNQNKIQILDFLHFP